jgi:plasmid stabilization system protein ParE
MTIRVVAAAERELIEAIDYYNEQRPGLGFEFAVAIRLAFDRIADYPDAWPAFSRRTRRCLVGGFPYGLLYQHEGTDILVLAIMHLRRAPVRWQDRVQNT